MHLFRLITKIVVWKALIVIGLFNGWFLFALAPPAGADIYTWRDSEGVTHFSNGEAPNGAHIYLAEPASDAIEADAPATATEEAPAPDAAADSRQDYINAETERALQQATDQVDKLSAEVERAREEARQATATAEQAQAAVRENAAAEPEPQVSDRQVVFAVPYAPDGYAPHERRRTKNHDHVRDDRRPSDFDHDGHRHPRHDGDRSKHFDDHRQNRRDNRNSQVQREENFNSKYRSSDFNERFRKPSTFDQRFR